MKIQQQLGHISIAIALAVNAFVFAPLAIAAELEAIVSRGKLIVGIKDNIRPLGYYDGRGNLQGFEIDIAKRLARELLDDANAVVLKPVGNQERLQVAIDGEVDIVIARVTATPARSRLVDFSNFYYLDGTGLVTKNPNLQRIGDFGARKIAVLEQSSTIAVIRYEIPTAQLVGVASYQEALTLLEKGEVDAFAADNSILTGWVQEHPQYRQLPVRLSGEALCVVIPKGLQYASLRDRINKAIARWQESGWLRERATYWGLP